MTMKQVIFVVSVLATTFVQANGMLPYDSASVAFYDRQPTSAITSAQPAEMIYAANRPQVQPPFWYHNSQPGYGPYPYHPLPYPQFYYLQGFSETQPAANKNRIRDFDDINELLGQKSARAIKRNKPDKDELLVPPAKLPDKVSLSRSDLSDITPTSLIFSARKQQHLETLIPELLNNQRLFLQDRERLQQLQKDIKDSKKISSSDEIWLQQLSEDYGLPEFELHGPGMDEGRKGLGHGDKELSKL